MSLSALRASSRLDDPGYPGLKRYLVDSTGLAFYLDKDDELAEKIGKRLAALALPGCAAYLALLHSGAAGETELDELIGDLTNGETYFFRFEEHFQALRGTVLPELIRRNGARRQIRIWSAGCSFGAEPYSIALLLRREFAEPLAGWDVRIVATDINRRFLAQAREGDFRDWALRGLDPQIRDACFTRSELGYRLREPYREGVSFQYHNLVLHPYPSLAHDLAAFDLIFCRNVLIYFGRSTIDQCVARFGRSLVEGGWLVVGHAEINPESFRAFRPVQFPGALLFQRPADADVNAAPPTAFEAPMLPDPIPPWLPPPAAPAWPPLPPVAPVSSFSLPPPEQPAAPPSPLARIRELADRARWTEAAEICQALVEHDRLDPRAHFYQALISEQIGRDREADEALSRAIYLDRGFVLAHYHRGLSLHRRRDPAGAARAFRNVVELLAPLPPETLLPEGDGLSASALRELTEMQLDLLGQR